MRAVAIYQEGAMATKEEERLALEEIDGIGRLLQESEEAVVLARMLREKLDAISASSLKHHVVRTKKVPANGKSAK